MASSVYISKAVEIGTAIFSKSKRRGSTNTPQITPLHLPMSYWYSGQSTSAQAVFKNSFTLIMESSYNKHLRFGGQNSL